ncbi:zf-HC2 domain-containing protein [Methylomonas paludis]|uniref:Zf-HC2 domain-containing protein n=1 Tax=Methylomonas paludis TaxID=1173101 RepID=A0A975MPE6_9GAMM|nr:zf-HC2 domain-containing protein [Methylomonas paludis]QWF71596.1 zf-HC2 domain-containing protein [Methylomonas paludis]
MPSCREISALVSKGLDKQLSLSERFAVRCHLMICRACRNFQKHSLIMRKISQAYLAQLGKSKP